MSNSPKTPTPNDGLCDPNETPMHPEATAFHNKIIQTSRGPVEFIDAGDGLPVLGFHGMGAGNDLFLELEKDLLTDGFRLIVPNRPGYYNTPISSGPSLNDCVDLAARLDHLQIDMAAVMGVSMGGLFATAFAARHPGDQMPGPEVRDHSPLDRTPVASGSHPMGVSSTAETYVPQVAATQLSSENADPRAAVVLEGIRRPPFRRCPNRPASLKVCGIVLDSMRRCLPKPAGLKTTSESC